MAAELQLIYGEKAPESENEYEKEVLGKMKGIIAGRIQTDFSSNDEIQTLGYTKIWGQEPSERMYLLPIESKNSTVRVPEEAVKWVKRTREMLFTSSGCMSGEQAGWRIIR